MKKSKLCLLKLFFILLTFSYLKLYSEGGSHRIPDNIFQQLLNEIIEESNGHLGYAYLSDNHEEIYSFANEEYDIDQIFIPSGPNDEWMIDVIKIIRIARRYKFQIKNKDLETLSKRNRSKVTRIQKLIQDSVNITLDPSFVTDIFLDDFHAQKNYEILIPLLREENRSFTRLLMSIQEIVTKQEEYKNMSNLTPPFRRMMKRKDIEKRNRRRTHSAEHYCSEEEDFFF